MRKIHYISDVNADMLGLQAKFWRKTLLYCQAVLIAVSILLSLPAYAAEPDEILSDARLEQRARALSAQLRCPVCRGETIDDSNAPLARDLRILLRERLQAGDSDKQVLDFMAARYGRYILLKPPFSGGTVFLWLLPPFIVLSAALYLWRAARRAALMRQNLQGEENEEETD